MGRELLIHLRTGFQNGLPRFLLWRISLLALGAGILAAFADLFQSETQRRAEARLLLQRGELIRENYENLRKHNEAVQSLRHDLRHHITALQGLCRDGDMGGIQTYLETLSSKPELNCVSGYTVHPAVDAVLTAMLARGEEAGVRAEVRVDLPSELPIPSSDLCPLLMNLLENALEANEKAPEGADKWLRVTMHIRGEYLYVGVENARFAPVAFAPGGAAVPLLQARRAPRHGPQVRPGHRPEVPQRAGPERRRRRLFRQHRPAAPRGGSIKQLRRPSFRERRSSYFRDST